MANQVDELMELLLMDPKQRRLINMQTTMVDIMRLMYQAGVQGRLQDPEIVALVSQNAVEVDGGADAGEVDAVLEVIGGLIAAHTVAGEWLLRTEKSARQRRFELMAEEATASDGSDGEVL
jgi:FAD/FMN-containing dehydrogenase